MEKKRKKGNGYEEVKRYILERWRNREHPEETYVRITGAEIAEAIGISAQMVNDHIRRMIRRGEVQRRRRCYFGRPTPDPETESNAGPRLPGAGYCAVREIVLEVIRNRRCKEDLFVRLHAEEIGAQVGLCSATVRFHIRNMIRRGVICRALDGSHDYAAVAEVQREQLRAWLRYRMQCGVFQDQPLLFFDPVEAAEALRIPDFEVERCLGELTVLDKVFRSVALIKEDEA